MPNEANPERKPIMTAEGQVAYLCDAKNVAFQLMDEQKAVAFLEERKGSHGAVRRALVGEYGMDEGLVAPVASVRVAMDLAALLICYDAYVREGGSRRRASETLARTTERFDRNADWFDKTYAVSSFMSYAVTLMETFSQKLA